MLINKLIMLLVCLSILLSVFTSGLISSALDLAAFSLLITYLLRKKKAEKKVLHKKQDINQ